MKAIKDLDKFKETLPYASEVFGTYTPLIGWKSKRIVERYNNVLQNDSLVDKLKDYFTGVIDPLGVEDCGLKIGEITNFTLLPQSDRFLNAISQELAKQDGILDSKDKWYTVYTEQFISKTLKDICDVLKSELAQETKLGSYYVPPINKNQAYQRQNYVINLLKEESKVAGVIQYLISKGKITELNKIFYVNPEISNADQIQKTFDSISTEDPFLSFNPNVNPEHNSENINDKVSLSPVGIVHLFRQYFFEFDTFLGSPVGHVWIAPNSTVEVIETTTRKIITEKTFETVLESINKTESSTTDQDDISSAVKQDNKNDLKLGATATAGSSEAQGKIANKWSASTSLNLDTSHQEAKEDTHKRMRQQSQKLSSEIRQNFKSTFKTITEVTDTNSKRYVITSATDAKTVANYELRRKMRQVGVQVQDIGSYLCWQSFVDNPGEDLGLANLVHIAKDSDTQLNPEPTKIPTPQPKLVEVPGSIDWFQGITKITTITIVPEIGYKVKEALTPSSGVNNDNNDGGITFKEGTGGLGVRIERKYVDKNLDGTTNLEGPLVVDVWLTSGNQPDGQFPYKISYVLEPTQKHIDDVTTANGKLISTYNATNEKAAQTALVDAAKERIKFASNITTRQYEDLREEERIIIYRKLIGTLLGDLDKDSGNNNKDSNAKLFDPDNKKRHILSELIQSIFDIDKMLYFVAPEWWKPKLFGSDLFNSTIPNNWQAIPYRRDNYFITEESSPAKMGSSLGWLLQLDGDKLRNAFLNAPWVKATIPIRPGKEAAALSWLKYVEGGSGLNGSYTPKSDAELQELRKKYPAPHQITIEDALLYLVEKIKEKHRMEMEGVPNDDNTVTPNPIEKVYEFGFNPMAGGFTAKGKPFDIFDQWVEVLPTDQIVAVPVEYNPITGMQI